ncbi:MAG: glycosyltransferase family 4 protein [Bacteroidales bacterium]|nr:glycosyltransferase family 4 protein [Bacteroidales bacterium]
MKIGFDAKRAFNNHRGLGNYSRETIRVLTSLAPENQYYLFTPDIDPDIHFPYPDDVIVEPSHKHWKLSQALWRTFGIAKEAEKMELDIYHGLSHELPLDIEKTKIRTVLTMHDLLFITHPELFPAFDRMMYRKKYLHSCHIADRIIAVSEQTKRELLELTDVNENKVEVVYQGCRPEFKTKITETQRQNLKEQYHLPDQFLLNVAAIEPRKNQTLILKALMAGKIDLPLVIAGRKTAYLKDLQDFITEHQLERQVMLLPDFPEDDLPALYQSASIFVFPSLYEGFGIPVVEALVSGLPVIAATGSCLEESGGPGSIYVSPTDENELAERILQVLSDESKQKTMIQNGLEHAHRFSDEVICQHITRIYKNLLP